MRKYQVRSEFRETNSRRDVRQNGTLGPFEKAETAERALIALCQAGQATTGEIETIEVPDPDVCETHGIEYRRCGCQPIACE